MKLPAATTSSLPSRFKSPTPNALHVERRIRIHWRLECSITVAEQHADALARIAIGKGEQVRSPIAVEVAHGNEVFVRWNHRVLRPRPERAVAVAEQNRKVGAERVRNRQVQIAIAVEVGRNNGKRLLPGRVEHAWQKSSISAPQEDRYTAASGAASAHHRQIENAVVIEITATAMADGTEAASAT